MFYLWIVLLYEVALGWLAIRGTRRQKFSSQGHWNTPRTYTRIYLVNQTSFYWQRGNFSKILLQGLNSFTNSLQVSIMTLLNIVSQ
jgi:hypothetical protein